MASTILDRVGGAVLGAPVQRLGFGRVRLIPSSGVDAIIATGSPTISGWVQWQEFIMRPLGSNTGAVTVDADGAGPKSLLTPAGGALPAGTLTSTQDAEFYYDGGNLILTGPF